MDASTLAVVFNALTGPVIMALTNWLKAKVPALSGLWTMVVTSLIGILFAFGFGALGLMVFPDQSLWVTALVGLGVNQTAAQASWTIYKKIKKPPTTPA